MLQEEGSTDGRFGRFLKAADEVEADTGLDFFADLPDDAENALEAGCPRSLWP